MERASRRNVIRLKTKTLIVVVIKQGDVRVSSGIEVPHESSEATLGRIQKEI